MERVEGMENIKDRDDCRNLLFYLVRDGELKRWMIIVYLIIILFIL